MNRTQSSSKNCVVNSPALGSAWFAAFRRVATAVIGTTVLIVPHTSVALDHDCVSAKYRRYVAAQEHLQRGVTDLLIQANPKLREVAELYFEDARKKFQRNQIAVDYLLEMAPTKIHSDAQIHAWLDLTIDDTRQISQARPRYAELSRAVENIDTRIPHPDGEKLRALMREKIAGMQEYKDLVADFRKMQDATNSHPCPR